MITDTIRKTTTSHWPCKINIPSSLYFTDPATTEIYTLSLHDALPISICPEPSIAAAATVSYTSSGAPPATLTDHNASLSPASEMKYSSCPLGAQNGRCASKRVRVDRKSTRLNSSH